MALQSLVRWLLPRELHFYDFLERQATVAHEGAVVLATVRDVSGPATTDVRARIAELEHQGDEIVRQVEEALARTFVTPIDREDIQRLSAELDDILDLTNLAARSAVLYGLDRPTAPMVQLVDKLVQCTELLKNAMPKLRQHAYGDLIAMGRAITSLEKEADAIYRGEVTRLFHDPAIDVKALLREKEILADLETAIDHCEHVAATLTNLAVKHG